MGDTAIQLADEKKLPGLVNPSADSAETLIARAIDKNVPIETMERLLSMRKELKAEAARQFFFRSLSSFQSECPVIQKSDKVDFQSKKGGRVHYSYAPLDVIVSAVKIPLREYGFSYTITTRQDEKSVTASCNVHHVDGHSEVTDFTIPVDPDAFMNAAQKVASALTYAKRYAFCNGFGILTGDQDDDARQTGEPSSDGDDKPKGNSDREMKVCPECGKKAIIKGQAKYGGGWVCWKKREGCGAKFPDDYNFDAPVKDTTDDMGSEAQREPLKEEIREYFSKMDAPNGAIQGFVSHLDTETLDQLREGAEKLRQLYRAQEVTKSGDTPDYE